MDGHADGRRAHREARRRPPLLIRICVAAALAACAALPAAAQADDHALTRALASGLPAVEAAASAAAGGAGGLAATQGLYDRARGLETALGRARPVSAACAATADAAQRYAAARRREAEGVDRLSAPRTRAAASQARRERGTVERLIAACHTGAPPQRRPPVDQLAEPRAGEAWISGALRTAAPPRAVRAEVYDGRRLLQRIDFRPRPGLRLTLPLSVPPGPRDPAVVFRDAAGHVVLTRRSPGAFLLPPSAVLNRPPLARSDRLEAAARAAAASFDGSASVWLHDLATGRYGASGERWRYPAASLVKLGLVAAWLSGRRFPEASPDAYEAQAVLGWSSNLAANRLLALVGGARAQEGLRRLGMRESTFPGPYIVGTRRAAGAPPVVSSRVTTARDLGIALYRLHAAATGVRAAQRSTGLSQHAARVALAMALRSESSGDNLGLVRPWLPGIPIAQKHGWISSARHTAAIAYTSRGPVVVVVLTYRPGVTRAEAAAVAGVALQRARITALP